MPVRAGEDEAEIDRSIQAVSEQDDAASTDRVAQATEYVVLLLTLPVWKSASVEKVKVPPKFTGKDVWALIH